jgi:TonB family protein
MGSKGTGTSGSGLEGSPTGNSATGKSTGTGGQGRGSFSLSGRSLGKGGLPNPVYNVQEGGTVVVAITVNPAGQVVSADVQLKGTTTTSTALRKAAVDAAKKARFNEVEGVNNQTGTITYRFNLN